MVVGYSSLAVPCFSSRVWRRSNITSFVDFHRTCQHCQFNYYSISISVTHADTCRLSFHKIPKTKHKFSVLFSSRYDNVYIWETDEEKKKKKKKKKKIASSKAVV